MVLHFLKMSRSVNSFRTNRFCDMFVIDCDSLCLKTKNKYKCSKIYFDVFGLFSKLRACNVSVAASGKQIAVGNTII